MGIWEILKSDLSLEYKIWALKLWSKIMYNEFLISNASQTFMAIIGDPGFWMTGAFVLAMCFFGEKEEKNVEFA